MKHMLGQIWFQWMWLGKDSYHENNRYKKGCVTVGLAAKGDVTKLKLILYIIAGKRDVEKLKKEYGNKCIIAFPAGGWVDTDLTLSWINTILEQFSSTRRQLAWDKLI